MSNIGFIVLQNVDLFPDYICEFCPDVLVYA